MSFLQTLAHLFHPRRSNNHRPRLLHPEVIGILSLLVIAVFSTISAINVLPGRLGSVLGYASSITPTYTVELTNAERAKAGLPALTANAELSAAALAKGQDMFLKQYWAHTAPDGTTPWKFIRAAGYSYQVAGENLARDFIITNEMVDAWMASPTHRANILNPRYTDIGIAVIDGSLEGVETTLVVQMFGTPRTTAVVAPLVQAAQTTDTVEPAAGLPSPVASPESAVEPPQTTVEVAPQPASVVLASTLVHNGELRMPPLFTPLQLLKAFFLAVVLLLLVTLTYDSLVIGHRQAMRLVGHNLSHVLLFLVIAFLLLSFKGGVLG